MNKTEKLLIIILVPLVALGIAASILFNKEPRTKDLIEIIPFETYSSAMVVSAKINGKSYNLIFDTGASTCISKQLAGELGLALFDTITNYDYYGNQAMTPHAILPEMTVGNMKFTNLKVCVLRPIQSLKICDVTVDGYLGIDVFADKVVQIDLKEKHLLVANKVYDLLNLSKVKGFKFEKNNSNSPHVNIVFPSNNSNEKVLFDTGSSNYIYRLHQSVFTQMMEHGLIAARNVVDTVDTGIDGRGLFGKQKDSVVYVVQFDTINFLGTEIYNCRAVTYNGTPGSIVGSPFLFFGKVTIDNVKSKLYFEPYDEKKSIDVSPKFGIYFGKNDSSQFVVKEVIKGSDAEKYGIKKDQRFIELNRIVLDSLDDCELLQFEWGTEFGRDTVEGIFLTQELDTLKVQVYGNIQYLEAKIQKPESSDQ